MPNIFISSTFTDLNAERDFIKNKIGTALNKYTLDNYGIFYDFTDLRLGVEDVTQNWQTINTCLYHLKKAAPPDPFIVIVGDRWGWQPNKKTLKDAVNKLTDDDSDIKTLLESKSGRSITNIEIDYGAYGVGNNEKAEDYKKRTLFIIQSKNTSVNEQKLKTLKDKISKDFPPDQIIYMDNYGTDPLKNPKFKADILEKLKFIIDRANPYKLNPDQIERKLHEEYMKLKASGFYGREKVIAEIKKSIDKNNGYTYIYGPSGIGKSSLISKIVKDYQKAQLKVFPIYCSLTTKSDAAVNIISAVTEHLKKYIFEYKKDKTRSILDEYKYVCEKYENSEETEPILIAIDAIDQLKPDKYKDECAFLSYNGHKKIRFLFSGTEDGTDIKSHYARFRELDKNQNFYLHEIKGIQPNETEAIIKGIFSNELNKGDLPEMVVNRLKEHNITSPLYLKLIALRIANITSAENEELQKAGTENRNEKYLEIVERFLTDTDKENNITQLENFCIKVLKSVCGGENTGLYHAMKYIALSRHGLPKTILKRVLKTEFSEDDFSNLLCQLKNIFFEHNDGCIDFTHKTFRNALLKEIKKESELFKLFCDILNKETDNDNTFFEKHSGNNISVLRLPQIYHSALHLKKGIEDMMHFQILDALEEEYIHIDFVKSEFAYHAVSAKEINKLKQYIYRTTMEKNKTDKEERLDYVAKSFVSYDFLEFVNIATSLDCNSAVDIAFIDFCFKTLIDVFPFSYRGSDSGYLLLSNICFYYYIKLEQQNLKPTFLTSGKEICVVDDNLLEELHEFLQHVLRLETIGNAFDRFIIKRRYQDSKFLGKTSVNSDKAWEELRKNKNFIKFLSTCEDFINKGCTSKNNLEETEYIYLFNQIKNVGEKISEECSKSKKQKTLNLIKKIIEQHCKPIEPQKDTANQILLNSNLKHIKKRSEDLNQKLNKEIVTAEELLVFYFENMDSYIKSIKQEHLLFEYDNMLNFFTEYISYYDYHELAYKAIKKCLKSIENNLEKLKFGDEYICKKHIEIAEFFINHYKKENVDFTKIGQIKDLIFTEAIPYCFESNSDAQKKWEALCKAFIEIRRADYYSTPGEPSSFVSNIEKIGAAAKETRYANYQYYDLGKVAADVFVRNMDILFCYYEEFCIRDIRYLENILHVLIAGISRSTSEMEVLLRNISINEIIRIKESLYSLFAYKVDFESNCKKVVSSLNSIDELPNWNWKRPKFDA